MKKIVVFFFSILVFLAACSDDEAVGERLGISFAEESINIAAAETPVTIMFNKSMPQAGNVVIDFIGNGAMYNTDFIVDVAVTGTQFSIPFEAGATSIAFRFTKLGNVLDGEEKNVVFTIAAVSVPGVEITGNKSIQLNFNETASLGGQGIPPVGGSNQPNQVYFDLSTGQYTIRKRTLWDLGFFCGAENKVVLNGSVAMAAKQLNTANIDEVQSADPTVAIGTFDPLNEAFVNDPTGSLGRTAIIGVFDDESANKVHIVNLGYEIPTTPAAAGSVNVGGTSRGWIKIRIFKSGNAYIMQYANLEDTTHNEITITKDEAYNFAFFSFSTGGVTEIEPQKTAWDLNFTTFTNIIEGSGSYFFSDFVVTNTKGGVRAYEVITTAGTYDDFTLADVTNSNFDTDAALDQRAIGANWRSVTPLQLYTNRFYVLKDRAGNIYKLKFNSMLSAEGERGYPVFEYRLLK